MARRYFAIAAFAGLIVAIQLTTLAYRHRLLPHPVDHDGLLFADRRRPLHAHRIRGADLARPRRVLRYGSTVF